jgi:hypothetical protein
MTKKKEKINVEKTKAQTEDSEPAAEQPTAFAKVASQAAIKQIVVDSTIGIKFEGLKFSPQQIEILARLRAAEAPVRITIEEIEPTFDSVHPENEPMLGD